MKNADSSERSEPIDDGGRTPLSDAIVAQTLKTHLAGPSSTPMPTVDSDAPVNEAVEPAAPVEPATTKTNGSAWQAPEGATPPKPTGGGGPFSAPPPAATPLPETPTDVETHLSDEDVLPAGNTAPVASAPEHSGKAGRGFFDIEDLTPVPEAPLSPGLTVRPQRKKWSFGKSSDEKRAAAHAAAAAARAAGPKDLAASVVVPATGNDLPEGGVHLQRPNTGGGVAGSAGGTDPVISDDGLGSGASGTGGGFPGGTQSNALDPNQVQYFVDEDAEKQKKRMLVLGGILVLLLAVLGGMYVFSGEDEVATKAGVTTTAVTTTTAAGAAPPGDAATTTTVATTAAGAGTDGTPAAQVAPGVSVSFTAAGAVLSGPVRTEEIKQQVLGGATLLFQNGLIDGAGLTVATDAPEINPNEDTIIKCLGEPVLQGVGAIGVKLERTTVPDTILISGTVSTTVAKDRIVGAVASVAGGLDRVIVKLEVASPSPGPTTTAATAPPGPTTTAKAAAAPATSPTTPPSTAATAGATTTTTPGPTSGASDVQNALDQLLQSKVIEFPSGSNALTPQWVSTVNEVAAALNGNSTKLLIGGHTDNVGDPAINLRLSVNRAESIKLALIQRGIAADRLTTTGYGASVPIADNATPEGRQKNRRIEFVIAAR